MTSAGANMEGWNRLELTCLRRLADLGAGGQMEEDREELPERWSRLEEESDFI